METIQFVMQHEARCKNKDISLEDEIKLISDELHVKKYIPIRNKQKLIKEIIDKSIVNNVIDEFEKYLNFSIAMVNEYTELKIDEQGYDLICSKRLLDKITLSFKDEYNICLGIMNIYTETYRYKR